MANWHSGVARSMEPEERKRVCAVWADMAADAVIRYMNGGYLYLVSFAAAAERVKREDGGKRKYARAAKPIEKQPETTKMELQIIAGFEMDMSPGAIARNVGISIDDLEKLVVGLEARRLL